MQKNSTPNSSVAKGSSLHIHCFDSIQVTDRTTFDSCVVDGLQVTFWLEGDAEERINKMFDMFFDELVKTRNKTILSVLEQ